MDGALTNAYAITAQYVGQRFTFWSEVLADHVKIIAAQDRSVMNFYNRDQALIADETANNGTNESSNRLRSIYQALNAAALVRRAAESGRVTEYAFVTNKDRIIGECYFIRAVLHFEMVRLWGHPWGKTPDNSHPGIIINKEPVENRESQIKARASVAEVYGLIIEDLLKAEELLPPSFDVGVHSSYFAGRATQDAARGYWQSLLSAEQLSGGAGSNQPDHRPGTG